MKSKALKALKVILIGAALLSIPAELYYQAHAPKVMTLFSINANGEVIPAGQFLVRNVRPQVDGSVCVTALPDQIESCVKAIAYIVTDAK